MKVRVDVDGINELFGRLVDDGVEAGLSAILAWFESRAYCADAQLWINPEDNDDLADIEHNRVRLVRRPPHLQHAHPRGISHP